MNAIVLSVISINPLVTYLECCSLIGYTTHLLCWRMWEAVVNKMAVTSLCFSVFVFFLYKKVCCKHFRFHLFILNRVVLTWASKVIHVYFGFALLRFVIGLKNSSHFLNQSQVKPKPIVTCRASGNCFEFWVDNRLFCVLCDWPE